ncbi:MAG: thiol-disulfide oxidoreductase DCC family protein [Gemmataceae bacterium]
MATTTLAPATNKAIVLFDGLCALCQRSVRTLRRLDVTGRLDCRDVRDPGNIPPAASAVEPQKFLEQMHLVTPGGQIYAGFPAFRWMAGRLPVLMPLWPFLLLPGVPWIGQKTYLWVARNRFHLVPCRDGQCAVPLPKRG